MNKVVLWAVAAAVLGFPLHSKANPIGFVSFGFTVGLEVEPGSVSVPLPLFREAGFAGISTNTLTVVRTLESGGSATTLETLIWAVGETDKTVTVVNQDHYVGGTITLTLSAAGEVDQTAVIDRVEDQPVSTVNPRFVGEPFTFGEWTMDLAAATLAVATTNVNACTLVFFTGALWCPYCMGMERDLLSTQAFKEFVRTNTIALVEIDNDKRDGSAPSLLRYAVYTGVTNDTRNGHSGAGYLSRHGITVADAEAVQARNRTVQAAWMLPGATRIGYPTLLMLRKDGSIAGRFSGSYRMTDNTVIPAVQSFDLGINMLRLHELLALARDPWEAGEEANGHTTRTAETLGARDSVTASLRAMDVKDVYVLRTAAGLRQTVAVSGPEDAAVQVAVLDATGQTVQAQSGSLTNGVAVTADITGTGVFYAAVTAGGAAVQVSNPNTTVRPYTLTTRFDLVVSEVAGTLALAPYAEDGTFVTSLATVSNAVYRFVANGAALTFPEGGFERVEGDLYRAVTGGDAALRLTDVSAGDTFTWQVLNPEVGGFTQAAFFGHTRVAFVQSVPFIQTTGGWTLIEKRSGALPPGVVAKVDQTAGKLNLTGVPIKEGSYTVVYKVWEIRGQKKVAGGVVQVSVTVAALETLNGAAAASVSSAEGAVIDRGSARLVGTLSVSVTKAARLTAKYLTRTGTVTFSGKSWTACEANGTVTAALSKGDYGVTVQMTSAGGLSAVVADPAYTDLRTVRLIASAWNTANQATGYVGYYTVSLAPSPAVGGPAHTGYSYMTVSLLPAAAKIGRVTYAGKLANGTSYSGSAVLQPAEGDTAHFSVFQRKASSVLAGLVSITANAKETYMTYPSVVSACGEAEPYWSFDSGYDETSFDSVFEICGGYYSSADSLLDFYALYAGTGPMVLMASGDLPESTAYGVPAALPFLELAVSESSLLIPSGADNPTRTRLSFTKATGLFRGTFKIPFVNADAEVKTLSANYAGVLLPGWTGDCGCGDEEFELPEKPFGMGAYWYVDKVPVSVGDGSRPMSVTRSYPIIMHKSAD